MAGRAVGHHQHAIGERTPRPPSWVMSTMVVFSACWICITECCAVLQVTRRASAHRGRRRVHPSAGLSASSPARGQYRRAASCRRRSTPARLCRACPICTRSRLCIDPLLRSGLLMQWRKHVIDRQGHVVEAGEHGSSEWFWKTTARSDRPAISRLSQIARLPSACNTGDVVSSVDLPQPECPIRLTVSPSWISKETFCSARNSPLAVKKAWLTAWT